MRLRPSGMRLRARPFTGRALSCAYGPRGQLSLDADAEASWLGAPLGA